MVFLNITLDTQAAYGPSLQTVFDGGEIIYAVGVLNLKWEEFSARDFAREAGLHEVNWEGLHDDTPGSMTVRLIYISATVADIKAKLNDPYVKLGLMDYDLTEIVERQTAETDF